MKEQTFFIRIGASLCGLAVISGAFGAHLLKDRLSDYQMQVYNKALLYHFFHALALLILPSLSTKLDPRRLRKAGWVLFVGIMVFSGSLYALALTNLKILGAITPIGGTLFIVGWFLVVTAKQKEIA